MKPWFEWEGSVLTNFLQILNTTSPRRDNRDGCIWNNNPSKPFSMSEAYTLLNHDAPEMDIFKFIWSNLVPSKISAFG